MTEPAQNYIPIDLHQRFTAQARNVWIVTAFVVLVWVGLIVVAPLFLAAGMPTAPSPVYTFFSYICHQIPERSLYISGHQMAVCSRCFGVYFGLIAGILIYPVWRRLDQIEPIPRIWLFLSLIPITIDWLLTIFAIWENTHLSRLVTGFILGAACATYIIPALVDIVRNFSRPQPETQ